MIILRNSYYSSPYYGGGYSDLEERLYTKLDRRTIAKIGTMGEARNLYLTEKAAGKYMQESTAQKLAEESGKGASRAVSAHLKSRRNQAEDTIAILKNLKEAASEGRITARDYASRRDALLEAVKKAKRADMTSAKSVPHAVAEGWAPNHDVKYIYKTYFR